MIAQPGPCARARPPRFMAAPAHRSGDPRIQAGRETLAQKRRGRPRPPSNRPGTGRRLRADHPAVRLGDRDHCRPRRHARAEVRPPGRRLLEGRAFLVAGVLYRHEQGLVVRREERSAQLSAPWRAQEVSRQGAAVANRVGAPDTVGEPGRARSPVRGDPQPSAGIDGAVVRARQPAVLRHVVVVDTIPRLPSGKVLRRTLRDEWTPSLLTSPEGT